MNKKMSPEELKEHITEFLREHKEGALATCLQEMPRSSPVEYFMGQDMDIYILSAGGEKFDAIRQNPNVCLLVNTDYINYRKIKGVQIFGQAETSETNSELMKEARQYFQDTYIMDHERENLKVIKIQPRKIVYLNSLEDGNRTKQILRNDEVILQEDRQPALV